MPIELKDRIEEVESSEKQKKPKLSERQYEFIDDELDKAVKAGVLRRADRMKVYADINNFSPSQLEEVENTLKEYLEKKKEKRDDYIKELDEAVLSGLISPSEHKQFLTNYDKLSGKDRKIEADEKMPKRLELKKMEKKEYEVLLKESPHFSKEGALTPAGQERLDAYNKPGHSEREKLVLKKRLIRETKKLDLFTTLCEDRHKIAGEHYMRGDFEATAQLMKKNMTTCARYPQSLVLQEQGEKSQRYAYNCGYEMKKNQQILDKRDEVQECFRGQDKEAAVHCAQEAVQLTEKFLKTTYDGKNGPYQEGAGEVARDGKWVTPYMTSLLQKVQGEEEHAKHIYEKLFKQEQDEEQRILDGEAETLDDALAEDARNQALIKAATDTLDDLGEQEQEENEETEFPPELDQHPLNSPEAQQLNTSKEDLQEDDEHERILHTHEAQTEPALQQDDVPQEEQEHQEEPMRASQATEEQLHHQEVVLDQERDGRLQENDADKLLRAEGQLKLQKKSEDLKSKDDIERELSRQLADSGLEKIKELARTGKISQEAAQLQEAQLKRSQSGEQLGRQILDEHQRTQRTIDVKQQQQTQSRLSNMFKKSREQDVSHKNDAEELRKRNAAKKREQMKRAA